MGHLFDRVPWHASDPVVRLRDQVRRDDRDDRLDLSHERYLDETGANISSPALRDAVRLLWSRQTNLTDQEAHADTLTKALFNTATSDLDRLGALPAPSHAAAVRMVLELLVVQHPETTIWAPDRTDTPHLRLARSLGLNVRPYRAIEAQTGRVALHLMLADLDSAAPGDVVLLHAPVLEPTGLILKPEAWQALAGLCLDRGAVPWVMATQLGLCQGFDKDRVGLQAIRHMMPEAIWTVDWAQTLGMAHESLGYVAVQTRKEKTARQVQELLKARAHRTFGTRGLHSAALAAAHLNDSDCLADWVIDRRKRRQLLDQKRKLLATALAQVYPAWVAPSLKFGKGLFAQLPLDESEAERLRKVHGVHLGSHGRLNLTALSDSEIARFVEALRAIKAGEDLPTPVDEFAHTAADEDWSEEIILKFPRAAAQDLLPRLDETAAQQALTNAQTPSDGESWSEDTDAETA
ncbi:MAG: aminotransferase class I/II-fold pyridoxal phosphate-dependent enzyme [Pseudomonadota bacterium]